MRARAEVVAQAGRDGGTRLAVLRSQAPVTLRPTAAGVYLAASAAGPLGGDEVEVAVTVGPGAHLVVRTVAAAVALPGTGGSSSFTWVLSVAAGGLLAVLPEPTVVAAGADHRIHTRAVVDADGMLVLREEVVLGRHGEVGGAYRSFTVVDVAGRPLLRSDLALDGADPATAGPASVVGDQACGSLLIVDPTYRERPPSGWAAPRAAPRAAPGVAPGAAAMPLAGPGLLVTATAAEARTVRACLDAWTPTLQTSAAGQETRSGCRGWLPALWTVR